MQITEKENKASLIACLIISSPIIASFLSNYIFGELYSGILVMGVIYLLLLVHFIKYGLHLKKHYLPLLLYLFIIVIVTLFTGGEHGHDLVLQFFEYGMLGLFAGTMKINSEDTLNKCTIALLFLIIPCFLLIKIGSTNEYTDDVSMGLSYGLLPLVFSVIVHFLLYRDNANKITMVSYLIAFVLLIVLLFKGTRGVWICLIVLLYLTTVSNPKYRQVLSFKRIFSSFIFILIFTLLLINIESFVMVTNNLLLKLGINSDFLNKSLTLISNGDFSNGRSRIYELAWKGFLDSPLWGNGVGAFSDKYSDMGFSYIHNMILQLLYEVGLVFSIPILVVSFLPIKTIVFDSDDRDLGLLIALFSSCVPMLMLSSEFWYNRHFWLMIGYYMSNIYSIKRYQAIDKY